MQLPNDVLNWLRTVFIDCNERVTFKLTEAPTTHEESLDMTFIESFSHHEAPVKLPSGWAMRFETHFLGGRKHWDRWEIADIGLLVMLRTAGKLQFTKVALLQSKRLYPNEVDFSEPDDYTYRIGFRRLFRQDNEWADILKPRLFNFDQDSKYKALFVGDNQYKAIREYEKRLKMPVYYLLYNPAKLPSQTTLPLQTNRTKPTVCEIGCRIASAEHVQNALANEPDGITPSYQKIHACVPKTSLKYRENWRLEDFAVDLLLSCQVGKIANTPKDFNLEEIFYRRSGPISSAISITVDAPEGYQFRD